ncbi:reverse transcriptase domain-containing protein [Tanacetum coccineum]
MESVSFPEPPPLLGTPEKQNLNKFCDYHEDRGHNTNDCYQLKKQIEEAVALGKLAYLVKDIHRNNQKNRSQGRNNIKVINMIRGGGNHKRPFDEERPGLTDELTFPAILRNQLTNEPIILEGVIKGNQVRKILVNNGSSSEIMYEQCFKSLNVNIRSRIRRCRAQLVGFLGEMYHPLGIIDLRVTMGKAGRNKTVLMEFTIIKCRSPYNVIIGRTGIRGLGAIVEIYLEEIEIKSKNEQVLVQDVEETLRKLKRVNIKIDPIRSSFRVKEGRFLGNMVKREGIRADPEKVQTIILSPTLKNPNQIRSLFLQLKTIRKFIPKLAEVKYPIHKVRIRFETAEGSGWTNEAEEALQRIKRKLNKLQTLAIPKKREVMMLCLCQRTEIISFVLLVERVGIQIPVSYVSRPLQGMEICYTPTEKMVQALIHTTRSLRAIFRKHKVKVVTDGPMEEILKLSRREGRFPKWATKETPDAHKGGTINLSKKLQAKLTPTPRAWRLYLGKETIKKGLGVGIILVSGDEKMHSYVICLKFNASNYAIDCETLLAGLAASISKATEQERKYKKEIMEATASFHRKYRYVSKQDHRWRRQVATIKEKRQAKNQEQSQTAIGKLVGAIE